jgi:uncharacterized protein (DUF1501 family)
MRTRRDVLAGLGGLAALAASRPGLARAGSAASSGRKLVVVYAYGGWDVTRVFTPSFASPFVAMEADAAAATVGGITYVDHPDRPSVRAWFEAWGGRALVLNGLLVPSVSHDPCRSLLFSGTVSGGDPDWATRIADAQRDAFALPHLVLSTVAFAGDLAEIACRVGRNGQLDGLLDGSVLAGADRPPTWRPGTTQEALLDTFAARATADRMAATRAPSARQLLADLQGSHTRAGLLKALQGDVSLLGGATLADQVALGVRVLAAGVSRCVTIEHPVVRTNYAWDTHSQNDNNQSVLFEELFAGLGDLMAALAAAPGTAGGATLLDETVVMVCSEMGRTPWLSPSEGKDHWPYTSVLLAGAGVAGDRVIGGFDDQLYGLPMDLATGELAEAGDIPTVGALGATLLTLADVDPGGFAEDGGAIAGAID